MRRKWLLCGILCGVVSLSVFGQNVGASNYDKQIKETEKQQKEWENKADSLQKEIEEIQADKDDTLKYIEKLDKKTASLEEELEKLHAQVASSEKKLKVIQKELAKAQKEKEKQYTTMKRRIKYMYENGNQEYLDIIFGAKSISDLLNRSEYVEKISEYDNKVFAHFKKAALAVQQKEKQREQQTNELKELETKTREEKQAVSELKADKKTELDKIDKAMEKSQDQVSEYTKKALEAENQVEALLQKKQDEIDREMAAGGGNSGGSTTGLGWPLKGGAGRISSGFGGRKSPTAGASTYHKGVDLAAPSGTPILAAGSGKVVTATYSSSAGNYIMISHGNRLYTVYMHCSRLAVSAGKQVTKGQVIGYVGSTGISTGAHLHFGVTKNGSYVNPLNYISR